MKPKMKPLDFSIGLPPGNQTYGWAEHAELSCIDDVIEFHIHMVIGRGFSISPWFDSEKAMKQLEVEDHVTWQFGGLR